MGFFFEYGGVQVVVHFVLVMGFSDYVVQQHMGIAVALLTGKDDLDREMPPGLERATRLQPKRTRTELEDVSKALPLFAVGTAELHTGQQTEVGSSGVLTVIHNALVPGSTPNAPSGVTIG